MHTVKYAITLLLHAIVTLNVHIQISSDMIFFLGFKNGGAAALKWICCSGLDESKADSTLSPALFQLIDRSKTQHEINKRGHEINKKHYEIKI